jgi:hypothetical protein
VKANAAGQALVQRADETVCRMGRGLHQGGLHCVASLQGAEMAMITRRLNDREGDGAEPRQSTALENAAEVKQCAAVADLG